jgi:hypothetical protein
MKLILISIFFASTVFASEIKCVSDNKVWQVNVNNDSSLIILKNGAQFRSFDQLSLNKYSINNPFNQVRTHFYEFSFGVAQYLDIERKERRGEMDSTGVGAFLRTSNPFKFDIAVNCKFVD